MKRPHVLIAPPDPAWPALFKQERDLLAEALRGAVVRIHHIGSTSVPGLAAKPIIDILAEATSLDAVDARNDALRALGYAPRGENGIEARR